jgi:organic radical activating enzyme
MLGNFCNYKCHYCFPGSNDGDHPWPDVDLLIKNTGHLLDTYKKQGKTKFEFFLVGGEATLWKQLPQFCNFLKDNYNATIRISTNASMSVNWWQRNLKMFDTVEISVHHEFVDPDHIIKVADMLYDKKINLVANVLMDPYHFEKCLGILEKLKTSKRRWPIVAKAVHFNGQSRYNEEQADYLKTQLKRWPNLFWWFTLKHRAVYKVWVVENNKKKRVEDNWLMLQGKNKFKGWQCNLGVDHIEIFQTGRIAGTCREKTYNVPFYYNLYDLDFVDKFNPEIKPIICRKDVCECGAEININKVIPIKLL